MAQATSDFLIIGTGIIGLAIARNLKARYPECSITMLEKEAEVAQHASGRNSGVLHAGFYYTADSLKAKFCREGNKAWIAYAQEFGMKMNPCGKVVVAQSESELAGLYELEKRGNVNGVELTRIDEQQLAEIEPNARTHTHALHVPATTVVDPVEMCQNIKKQLQALGVVFYFATPYVKRTGTNEVQAGDLRLSYGTLINCGGLYADHIARDFGASEHYTIIPFKGLYLKYTKPDRPVRTNIYPVPNLANPFLGVHFTITVDGTIKIGPTAIPAFWRENYKGFDRMNLGEMANILGWEANLFARNAFNFRALAFEESKKYRKSYMVEQAMKMVKHIDGNGFTQWSKPGIRAQLLDKRNYKLVQDFIVEAGDNSVHVLNAVSPAFTCSLPFADWVVENYITPAKAGAANPAAAAA